VISNDDKSLLHNACAHGKLLVCNIKRFIHASSSITNIIER